VYADESAHVDEGLDLVLSAGLTFGGDDLAATTNGETLEAGGLMLLGVGGIYSFEDSNFQLQGLFGYHFDEVNAADGSADFKRTTLEIMPFYKVTEDVRLGVGYLKVMSPSYSDPWDNIDFEDSNGLVMEVDWRLKGGVWLGVRYADLEYLASSINGIDINLIGVPKPIDGSYFGIVFHASLF
jgi:hypothetical protein